MPKTTEKLRECTVRVTKKDIKNGEPFNPACCPVTIAAERRFGWPVCTGLETISINNLPFKAPYEVRRFVDRFDAGKEVKPFSFKLKVPVSLL